MSTSPNPAAEPARRQPDVRPFPYADAGISRSQGPALDPSAAAAQTERNLEEAARAAGRREGEAAARAALEKQLLQLRESIRNSIADFAHERARYYAQVETEVVRLALSIARKVLHREAAVDPLLLAGIARVALDKMESATKVTVRVCPEQVSEFRTYFAQTGEPEDTPDVIEDGTLPANHCKLETSLGTTELGLEVQLKEIEQGLMDLMAQRPQCKV